MGTLQISGAVTKLLYRNSTFCKAILSVYDKTGLIELAKELNGLNIRLLGSGGTAKKIREAGIPISYVADYSFFLNDFLYKNYISQLLSTACK